MTIPAREGIDDTAFLEGGGTAGERLRAVDWPATPLGPPEQWPRSLKTVVRIALDSRYAMWFAWGPELSFFCNDAYAPTLGLKQAWAMGAPASRVWAEIWPDIGPRIDSVLRTGKATWDERLRLILQRSGAPEETYHTFSYSPLPDDLGHIRGMLCVVTEDTERVLGERRTALLGDLAKVLAAAQSEPALFEALAESLGTSCEDLPFTCSVLRADSGLLHEAGCSGGPRRPGGAIPLADWPLADVLASGVPATVDAPRLLAQLPRGPWDRPPERALLLPIASPGQSLAAGIFVAALNPYRPLDDDYRRFLQLAVGQVAAALASARAWETGRRRAEELTELDRAKTTFFSNVSHELRTPLTLMIAPTEAALSEPGGVLAGEELQLVHRNQQRLLRLVNSLLDFARIEAGRLQPALEPVDLAEETAHIASVFRSAVERAGMRFVVDCPSLSAPVWIDRDMWEKIVLNLLSNAFKYTLSGAICIALHEEDGIATLRVRDTGIGVPHWELPKLFDRFHRVEGARGRTLEGTGIGLALVRELAALLRGRVDVASVPGEGSTFSVALPIDAPTNAAAMGTARDGSGPPATRAASGAGGLLDEALRWLPAGDAVRPAGGNGAAECRTPSPSQPDDATVGDNAPARGAAAQQHVLVVDDNGDMRAYLGRLLGARWRVSTASDGVDALEFVRRELPDLVLTDVMMPRLDGMGLLAALRAERATASLPVILLSARAGDEARLDGLRAGADDYLAKPFGARELVARIDALLMLARTRRDAMWREEVLRAETRTVLETIHEGYLLVGMDGRIAQVNAAAEEMTGRTRAQLVGRVFWQAFDSLRGSLLESSLRAAERERIPAIVEHHVGRSDRWFEVSVYPDPKGLVVYARDISERKRAMFALQDADRRKDEFLATLAHELRNPLAPIRSAAEILASAKAGESELVRTRNVIRRQTRHMSRLLDDLLDVSRITRGRLELKREPTPIGTIVDTAVEATAALLPDRLAGLRVEVAERDRIVDADPVRLAQILTNLLNNAAKFSDAAGSMLLSVRVELDELVIWVRDSGVGMTADQIAHAFELFSQFPSVRHRGEGGLGIGLALVRAIVALHGGTVTARSDGLGRGSEFVVRLPLAASGAAPAVRDAPPATTGDDGARRVLVVDDNVDAALMLATFLETSGHVTSVVHTGRDALAAAASFEPDVLLLDIGLPDINGYEVARGIRADAALRAMTLIAVTGWGQAEDLTRSREAGFDFHLVKPADPEALLGLLAVAPRRVTAA